MAELITPDGTSLTLRPEGTLIGRRDADGGPQPDIDLTGQARWRTVSRQHARIFRQDDGWYLAVEVTARNSTKVAGREMVREERARLSDGDEVWLGELRLRFKVGYEPPRSVEASAELRSEGQHFPLIAPEGRELLVGRRDADLPSHRPDIDLGDLPTGHTVSRRHGRLYSQEGQWRLHVEADVTNPTLINGGLLRRGEEVALTDGSVLTLGGVTATFHQLVAVVGPEVVELSVSPTHLEVEPGDEAEATVTVVNHTGLVNWFRIAVQGLEPSWYEIKAPDRPNGRPDAVELFHAPARTTPEAGAVGQLKLIYRPPKQCSTRAGSYPLIVSATTQNESRAQQVRRVTTAQLSVGRFEQLELDLGPEEIIRRKGEYRIGLRNAGNDKAAVALEVEAQEELKVELSQSEFTLANCAQDQANLKLKVRLRKRHWTGVNRRYQFGVRARSGQQELLKNARLTCPPIIPEWLQSLNRRVLGILVPLAMLAALIGIIYAFFRPPDVKFTAEPNPIIVGTPVTLSWSTQRATSASLKPSGGDPPTVPEGKTTVTPDRTTEYELNARNWLGIGRSENVTIGVTPAPPKPTASLTADQPRLDKDGAEVTLRWTTQNAETASIDLDGTAKEVKLEGEEKFRLTRRESTFKLVAKSAAAGSVEKTVTVSLDAPEVGPIVASKEDPFQGDEVKLRWSGSRFASLKLKASKGGVVPGKEEIELPAGTTEQVVQPIEAGDVAYTLTATTAGGSTSATLTIKVQPIKVDFKAEKPSILRGESTNLTWTISGRPLSVALAPGDPLGPTEVKRAVKPEKTTVFTLTVVGPDKKEHKETAEVQVGVPAAEVELFASTSTSITEGDEITLSYGAKNAKSVTITTDERRTVLKSPNARGTVKDKPTKSTTYTVTATDETGRESPPQAVTVEVRPPTPTPAPTPPPTPAPPPPAPPKP